VAARQEPDLAAHPAAPEAHLAFGCNDCGRIVRKVRAGSRDAVHITTWGQQRSLTFTLTLQLEVSSAARLMLAVCSCAQRKHDNSLPSKAELENSLGWVCAGSLEHQSSFQHEQVQPCQHAAVSTLCARCGAGSACVVDDLCFCSMLAACSAVMYCTACTGLFFIFYNCVSCGTAQ
jgi:hypothetical protein